MWYSSYFFPTVTKLPRPQPAKRRGAAVGGVTNCRHWGLGVTHRDAAGPDYRVRLEGANANGAPPKLAYAVTSLRGSRCSIRRANLS